MTREPPFAAEVAAYLDHCAAWLHILSPKYHPTENGAVKTIYHRHRSDPEAKQAAEDQIRAAYRGAVDPAARHRKEPPVSATPARNSTLAVDNPRSVDAGPGPGPGPGPELMNAALECAARGWHVMPVRPRTKKPPAYPDHAAPDCTGRDPRCRGGHVGWEPRATADPGRIRRGWAGAAYNVGIATGPSGLIVVDLDQPKPGDAPPPRWALPGIHDGADVLAALCEEHDEPFPWETLLVRTGRGGLHLYFTAPPGANLRNTAGSNGGLGWLIDTRAGGGYVIAPGSVVDLPDGTTGRYELIYDRAPAPLPAWLAALLTAPRQNPPSLARRPAAPGDVRHLASYARAAIQRESEAVRGAAAGGRTHVLNTAAFNLGQLIAAGALPDDGTAEAALHEAASVHFTADEPVTPAEARSSIRGGLAAGKRHPRRVTAA